MAHLSNVNCLVNYTSPSTFTITWSSGTPTYFWSADGEPPPLPSDAEIVAEYEKAMRVESCRPQSGDPYTVMRVGHYHMAMSEVREAWSRELKRRRDGATETERLRVRVQIDDPDEA